MTPKGERILAAMDSLPDRVAVRRISETCGDEVTVFDLRPLADAGLVREFEVTEPPIIRFSLTAAGRRAAADIRQAKHPKIRTPEMARPIPGEPLMQRVPCSELEWAIQTGKSIRWMMFKYDASRQGLIDLANHYGLHIPGTPAQPDAPQEVQQTMKGKPIHWPPGAALVAEHQALRKAGRNAIGTLCDKYGSSPAALHAQLKRARAELAAVAPLEFPAPALEPPVPAPATPVQGVDTPAQTEASTSLAASEEGRGETTEHLADCLCCEGQGGRGSIPCGECGGVGVVSVATKQAQVERLAAIKATRTKLAAHFASGGHPPTPGEVEAMLTEEPPAERNPEPVRPISEAMTNAELIKALRSELAFANDCRTDLGRTIRTLEAENRELRGQAASLEQALEAAVARGERLQTDVADLTATIEQATAAEAVIPDPLTFEKWASVSLEMRYGMYMEVCRRIYRRDEALAESARHLAEALQEIEQLNRAAHEPILLRQRMDGSLTPVYYPGGDTLPAVGDQYAEPVTTTKGQRRYHLYWCTAGGDVDGRPVRLLMLVKGEQEGEVA